MECSSSDSSDGNISEDETPHMDETYDHAESGWQSVVRYSSVETMLGCARLLINCSKHSFLVLLYIERAAIRRPGLLSSARPTKRAASYGSNDGFCKTVEAPEKVRWTCRWVGPLSWMRCPKWRQFNDGSFGATNTCIVCHVIDNRPFVFVFYSLINRKRKRRRRRGREGEEEDERLKRDIGT